MAGGRIDLERAFTPVNLAVMTISDSRDASSDSSGDLLAERIAGAGHALKARSVVGFDKTAIQAQARAWIGEVEAIGIDPQSGDRLGAADQRRRGTALGY